MGWWKRDIRRAKAASLADLRAKEEKHVMDIDEAEEDCNDADKKDEAKSLDGEIKAYKSALVALKDQPGAGDMVQKLEAQLSGAEN
eukprot:4511329-Alexandrium_andersonii.AAC.1